MDKLEERLMANAAHYLIEGGEEDAASLLLSCELRLTFVDHTYSGGIGDGHDIFDVELIGRRFAYDILSQRGNPLRNSILGAFHAIQPFDGDGYMSDLVARIQWVDIDPDWQHELLEIARGTGINNQAMRAANAPTWNNLRFRSGAELRLP